MPYLSPDDVMETRISLIEARFPKARIEFSRAFFDDHLELRVFVRDADSASFDEVKRFCDDLEKQKTDPEIPIWIFTEPWSGPWPSPRESAVKIIEEDRAYYGTRSVEQIIREMRSSASV